ncbi:MAG: sigma-70 family RNA polymerase sigma factor [Gammaproteobacteria bacterium]|nr:sigma-70 family RNA polymerase sigma factor [Gammaproteobacteria bacterium]
MKSEETDDQLMQAYARGHLRAFDRLYARYSARLFAYLVRNCRDRSRAEELYQDIWLRVISSAEKYKPDGRFDSWIFTLAHHRLVDYYKSSENRAQTETFQSHRVTERGPEEEVSTGHLLQTIETMVDALPSEQKMAFYLREESGFSIREIAGIQGISPEAAKSRLRYAYEKLRKALKVKGIKGESVSRRNIASGGEV